MEDEYLFTASDDETLFLSQTPNKDRIEKIKVSDAESNKLVLTCFIREPSGDVTTEVQEYTRVILKEDRIRKVFSAIVNAGIIAIVGVVGLLVLNYWGRRPKPISP